jgi:hypothetical protein
VTNDTGATPLGIGIEGIAETQNVIMEWSYAWCGSRNDEKLYIGQ